MTQPRRRRRLWIKTLDRPTQTGGSHRADDPGLASVWRARQMGRRQMLPPGWF